MSSAQTISTQPVALVTGSGTGVGKACALRLAKMGYAMVINYSRSKADAEQVAHEIDGLGGTTLVVACDVSEPGQVAEMLARTAERFGRLDVLVNNAAMTYFVPLKNLDEMTCEQWDRILDVNLKGPFNCVRAAAKLLSAGTGGAVVNVSSVAGQTGRGSCIAYAASKGGLNTLTKSLALALAPKVRVNAVLPGPIDSRWIREGNKDWDLTQMTAHYPLPRPSQPDEIADAVVYLATGTSMTTGQLLVVDGGQTL
jgi:3-oxoacyl-[acyl-carrier protein] reductase